MKKLKLILPMLAFVLAIGMSFAMRSNELDYYQDNGWKSVPEIDCSFGEEGCYIRLEENGNPIQLFDTPA